MPEEPNKRKSRNQEPTKKKLRDRYNEARDNMRDNKLVKWAQENRVPLGIGVGGVTFGFLLRGKAAHLAPTFNNTVSPVFEPMFINTVSNGGPMRKIIRCVETDEMWPSMKAAAEATGNHLTMMSKHCNGHVEDLHDLHYVIEGLASG